MTIQQCKYVLEIAKTGSFNEAAKQLFVAQSSLSGCIKQLEAELGIRLFERSNRGVILTSDGAEFIRYASQMVEQNDFIVERYRSAAQILRLHIATQHYDFISDLFCRLLHESGETDYHFSLREIKTYEIIYEVEHAASDIGILAIRDGDRELMGRFLHKKGLSFTPFLVTSPYVFVRREHPLAQKGRITSADLRDYPYVFYDQGTHNTSFFTEELTDELFGNRRVEISDRASLMGVLLSSDCYTIGTGIMPSKLNDGKIISVPLESQERYSVGYLLCDNRKPTALLEQFIQLLGEFAETHGNCAPDEQ